MLEKKGWEGSEGVGWGGEAGRKSNDAARSWNVRDSGRRVVQFTQTTNEYGILGQDLNPFYILCGTGDETGAKTSQGGIYNIVVGLNELDVVGRPYLT